MIKCNGCGAIIQDTDDKKPGFVPKINDKTKYCMRCYKMIHYNELPKIIATNEDYIRVIDNVLKKDGLIIYVVDIFQFKNTFRDDMINRLRDRNVILVANKFDIFPHSTVPLKIVDWLNHQCMSKSFKVLASMVVSSKNGLFIKDLVSLIEMFRKEDSDVYFVGSANVGKSSLINAILRDEYSIKTDTISTSVIPGTTLNEINIPFFNDNGKLVDTPGLINDYDVLGKLLPKSYEKIMPKTELKPKTYPLDDNLALFIGGLASIEVLDKGDSTAIIYASNDIKIHKTNTSRVDDLLNNRIGEVLLPPTKEEVLNISYETKEIEFDGKKKKAIWFSGFGFITILGKCKIKVRYIKGTEVLITNAII